MTSEMSMLTMGEINIVADPLLSPPPKPSAAVRDWTLSMSTGGQRVVVDSASDRKSRLKRSSSMRRRVQPVLSSSTDTGSSDSDTSSDYHSDVKGGSSPAFAAAQWQWSNMVSRASVDQVSMEPELIPRVLSQTLSVPLQSSVTSPRPAVSKLLDLPTVPLHDTVQRSLLSTESPANAPSVDFRGGLFNLGFVAIFVITARPALENLSQHGVLVRLSLLRMLTENWEANYPSLIVSVFIFTVAPIVAHCIEAIAVIRSVSASAIAWSHFAHTVCVFLLPQIIITVQNAPFLGGLVLMFVTLVLTMKLTSFAHVCHHLRLDHPQSKYRPSLSHTFYFILAPTLIYQLRYPRSDGIRIRFLAARVTECLISLALQIVLVEQYMYPTVRESMVTMASVDPVSKLARVLQISVPNGAVWLLMFYSVFHSLLNIVAELLRFGDRMFYKDWWNCPSIDHYWRQWNLPVHHFIGRHIFAPLTRAGWNSEVSRALCFAVSAVAHELLICVPLHQMRGYVFVGMMAQIPLIQLTRGLTPAWGNRVFWLSFLVLGQPTLILLLYHSLTVSKMEDSSWWSSWLANPSGAAAAFSPSVSGAHTEL